LVAPEKGSALFLAASGAPDLEALRVCCEREADLEVQWLNDGLQGLRQARMLEPRLVLTELLLGGVDGLRICRSLRESPATRSAKVMVLSTLAAERMAIDAGADLFVRRPIDSEQLIGLVRGLLGISGVPAPLKVGLNRDFSEC
jgi:DNA-binding response OmpR family regulator